VETPAERLNSCLAEETPRLDHVLATIATVDDERSAAEIETAVVAELDRLADSCPSAPDAMAVLNHVYGTAGFSGDVADYYDPANSLIDRVVERRRGIPLTLAAIAAEIGRRLGVDLRPIGMPGHVLLGEGPDPTHWFDPFSRGAQLGYDDCRLLFARFHAIEAFNQSMLRPMTAEAVAIRTLNNLRIAYVKRGQAAKTIPVLELRAAMTSAELADRLELANLLMTLGRMERAAEEYETLAAQDPERRDAYMNRATACRAHNN